MEGIIELTDGDGRRARNELVFVFVDREASELGFHAETCNGDCSSSLCLVHRRLENLLLSGK